MTGVIKFQQAAASNVRPLPSGGNPKTPAARAGKLIDPKVKALELELHQALLTTEEKNAEIVKLLGAVEEAYKDGEAAGRAAARKDAESERETLLSVLEDSARQALEAVRKDMESLERLAAMLAIESLNKILGDPGVFAELAPRLIHNQLARLDPVSIVRMQVSPSDFPSEQELATLAVKIGHPTLEIIAADDLESGDCRLNLVLGTLDVGLNQQWGQLKTFLDDLAAPVTAP